MRVIQAREGDQDAISALDHLLGGVPRSDTLRNWIRSGECWIATSDGSIVGFVVATRSFFGQPFIELLVVAPQMRRRGVGIALVNEVEAMARSRGRKLFTSTNESNEGMHAFCAAAGFVRSGVIENLDESDPETVYFKALL